MTNPFSGMQTGSSRPNPFATNPGSFGAPSANGNSSSSGNAMGKNPFAPSNAAQNANGPSPFHKMPSAAAPPANPFAPNSGNANDNKKPSVSGNGESAFKAKKTTGQSPFLSDDGDSSDGSKKRKPTRQGNTTFGAKPTKPAFFSRNDAPKPTMNGFQNTKRRPSSSRGNASDVDSDREGATPRQTIDPHARRVYAQLRKDGISPPAWPSQPGDSRNKAAMAKFRESFEEYRSRVRASLTKAGLIDDPEKRKSLKDAIDFKGICEDMCPEYEKITRITELDVVQPEKNPQTGIPNVRLMVKKLARSAAGQEAPLPMDVRSVPTLKRTLDYLIDDLLRSDDRLPTLHGFLWDRTRAIRRDFTFFSSLTSVELKMQIYVLETIAKFHVTSLHLLSQDGKAPEDFVEQQELEQLGKSLLSLRDLYDDCNAQGIVCDNEAEFRAYYIVFHARDPQILEVLQRQWRPSLWNESDEVRTAVSLVEALQNTQDFHGPLSNGPSLAASSAYASYFRIVEDPQVSYTMACFAECHFPTIRRSMLSAVNRALARPKETAKDVTAEVLTRFLRFDNVKQSIDFAKLHDLDFLPNEELPGDLSRQYVVLDTRNQHLPQPRLQHQFSQGIVEGKRNGRPLPSLMHHAKSRGTTAEQTLANGNAEESLFVSDNKTSEEPAKVTSMPSGTVAASSPPSVFGVPQNSTGQFASSNSFATKPSPFVSAAPSSIFQKPNSDKPLAAQAAASPFGNPFAQATSAGNTTPPRPFGKPNTAGPATSVPETKPPLTTAMAPANSPISFAGFKSASPFPAAPAQPVPSSAPTQSSLPSVPSFSFSKPAAPTPSPPPASLGMKPNSAESSATPGRNAEADTAASTDLATPPPPTMPSQLGTSTANPAGSSTTPLGNSFMQPSTKSKDATPPLPKPPKLRPGPGPSPLSQQIPAVPASPEKARKDMVDDFTRWFVLGDRGLLAEFQVYMAEDIVKEVYQTFQLEEAERMRQEEEARNLEKAENFRVYNISLKFFYRWKEQARKKRLRAVYSAGREKLREFQAAQRRAEVKEREEARRTAKKRAAERAEFKQADELMATVKKQKKKSSRKDAETALLESGVLAGVANEREAVARVIKASFGRTSKSPPPSQRTSASPTPSSACSASGKIQKLREQFGKSMPATFRRSMPHIPTDLNGSSNGSSSVPNRASERWRLKALGIVQLPDGTAVPESMARDMYAGIHRRYPSVGTPSSRRASITGTAEADSTLSLERPSTSAGFAVPDGPAGSKRKRPSVDVDRETGVAQNSSHKRVMSDAEQLRKELRAMREEMEEGAEWFKEQNERLQNEMSSRDSTPWARNV